MKRKTRLVIAAAAAIGAAVPLLAPSAYADYAPSGADVVGVGSDTVQYAGNFVADSDHTGNTGYNALGNLNKIVNFDATPDANSRLAYGPEGIGTGQCSPGEGAAIGTGNQTTTHANQPCTLNPTIVLQSGLSPVLRPNGSGAGGQAGRDDVNHYIDYVRASSNQGGTLRAGTPSVQWDSVKIGEDPLAMLSATVSNAVPLSTSQLNLIYSCSATTWNDPRIGGTSPSTIIPIVPQVGSGTRGSFLTNIGNPTLGLCVQTSEENDPAAIRNQVRPEDAIAPMSGGRLNLYEGKLSDGSSNGVGGYFQDPSCPAGTTNPNCANKTLTPAVKLWKTGTPTGTPAPGAIYNVARPLFIYFRNADIAATAPYGADRPFQPGSTLNFVRSLFYNPCSAGQTGCITVGLNTYGPGGAPYFATSAGQALISSAGIVPAYTYTANGP